MITAQEYIDNIGGLEKEAWVPGAITGAKILMGRGASKGIAKSVVKSVGKFTVKPPTASFGTRMGNRYKTAKKWSNEQYGKYKKTDMSKNYGDKPLYAAGALGAFGAGRATGGSDVNIRI